MSFHLYSIQEIFSNADGSVQFVELAVGNFNGESFWAGQALTASRAGQPNHVFTFPAHLPSSLTANTTVLVATQGFAELGLVTPDFIMPAGFLYTAGGSLNFAFVDTVNYGALPADGVHSVNRSGTIADASPRNFAGQTHVFSHEVVINGTAASEPVTGSDAAETLNGLGGHDTLDGAGGNDSLDGGSGVDSAVFAGTRAASELSRSGSTITVDVANQFYAAGVTFGVYGADMSDAQFIAQVYDYVLGRPSDGPTPPTADDIAFWEAELDSLRETKGTMVLRMLRDTHEVFAGDPEVGFVADLLDNKAAVAHYYAVQQGLGLHVPADNIAYGVALADLITPTDTSAAITFIGVNAFSLL